MMNNWFISVNSSQFGELKVWFDPTPPNLRLQSTVIRIQYGGQKFAWTLFINNCKQNQMSLFECQIVFSKIGVEYHAVLSLVTKNQELKFRGPVLLKKSEPSLYTGEME